MNTKREKKKFNKTSGVRCRRLNAKYSCMHAGVKIGWHAMLRDNIADKEGEDEEEEKKMFKNIKDK